MIVWTILYGEKQKILNSISLIFRQTYIHKYAVDFFKSIVGECFGVLSFYIAFLPLIKARKSNGWKLICLVLSSQNTWNTHLEREVHIWILNMSILYIYTLELILYSWKNLWMKIQSIFVSFFIVVAVKRNLFLFCTALILLLYSNVIDFIINFDFFNWMCL